ncbi:MAG: hypothetical protein IPO22_13645 [Anaerolineales bacterium]|nr:hypothetical protein [Anaerolineales bacterium]
MNRGVAWAQSILIFLSVAILLAGACVEFFNVASGTGSAVGSFSLTWLILFSVFVLFCLALFVALVFWQLGYLSSTFSKLIAYRNRMSFFAGSALLVLVFPVWFLQYTQWGIVFQGFFIRLLIWTIVVFATAFLTSSGETLAGWQQTLGALALTAASFSIAVALQGVTDYPFSLGWSEGNRLWDYSTLFGKSIYFNIREDDTILFC